MPQSPAVDLAPPPYHQHNNDNDSPSSPPLAVPPPPSYSAASDPPSIPASSADSGELIKPIVEFGLGGISGFLFGSAVRYLYRVVIVGSAVGCVLIILLQQQGFVAIHWDRSFEAIQQFLDRLQQQSLTAAPSLTSLHNRMQNEIHRLSQSSSAATESSSASNESESQILPVSRPPSLLIALEHLALKHLLNASGIGCLIGLIWAFRR